MIEVLVTLVIVAVALLGTAGLQIYALKLNKSGEFRTQAVFAASDLLERMEANKTAAIAGSYAVSLTSTVTTGATDCSAAACNATALAAYDVGLWETTLVSMLPQSSWSVTQTAAGPPSDYSIVINWIDRSSDKTSSGESFSYTATRSINN
jgi:type IV pilus assembly protein PilV